MEACAIYLLFILYIHLKNVRNKIENKCCYFFQRETQILLKTIISITFVMKNPVIKKKLNLFLIIKIKILY